MLRSPGLLWPKLVRRGRSVGAAIAGRGHPGPGINRCGRWAQAGAPRRRQGWTTTVVPSGAQL